MVKYKDYVAGWIAGSIREFLEVFPRNSSRMNYVLISSLDSEVHVSSMLQESEKLKALAAYGRIVGKGLLVPTKRLLDARDEILFGFDELSFFPTDRVEPKPESASLVGPNRISQEQLNTLGEWMVKSSCSLALGDGVGLNFVLKARGLVSHLLAFTAEQPEPSLRYCFEEAPWNPETQESRRQHRGAL